MFFFLLLTCHVNVIMLVARQRHVGTTSVKNHRLNHLAILLALALGVKGQVIPSIVVQA